MAEAPQPSRFSPALSQGDLAAGYKKMGNAPSFTRADLTKAYAPYAPYGIKVNPLHEKKTDAQLYKVAASAVILKHRATLKKRAAVVKPVRTAQLLAAARLPGAHPPPYALATEAALLAWIKRALALKAANAPKPPAPVYSSPAYAPPAPSGPPKPTSAPRPAPLPSAPRPPTAPRPG